MNSKRSPFSTVCFLHRAWASLLGVDLPTSQPQDKLLPFCTKTGSKFSSGVASPSDIVPPPAPCTAGLPLHTLPHRPKFSELSLFHSFSKCKMELFPWTTDTFNTARTPLSWSASILHHLLRADSVKLSPTSLILQLKVAILSLEHPFFSPCFLRFKTHPYRKEVDPIAFTENFWAQIYWNSVPFPKVIQLMCSLFKPDFSNVGAQFSNTDQILKTWFLLCPLLH